MTSSCGDTEAGCGNLGTPHGSHTGWAIQQTPEGLPVMLHSSLAAADNCGLSPQRRTCQLERLWLEQMTDFRIPAQSAYSLDAVQRRGASTWTLFVCLEVSYRWCSAHGDELRPKLCWLLKHQKDPQSLERAAAMMPAWKDEMLSISIQHVKNNRLFQVFDF